MASIDKVNDENARIVSKKMNLDNLSSFINPRENYQSALSFMMSGSNVGFAFDFNKNHYNYYNILADLVFSASGNIPVFIFHHYTDIPLTIGSSSANYVSVGEYNSDYILEPFLGFSDIQIVNALRRMAKKLDYAVTPHFDNVVRTMLSLIRIAGMEVCLSSIYHICTNYSTISAFHGWVTSLPDRTLAEQLFNSLGLDKDNRIEQFILFRSIISAFAEEISKSNEFASKTAQRINLITQNNEFYKPVICMAVNDTYSNLLFNYLTDEFKAMNQQPFILIFDNIMLSDEYLLDYLVHRNSSCILGILSKSIPSDVRSDRPDIFSKLTESIDVFYIFKHKTSSEAESFSRLIGNFDMEQEQFSSGTSKDNFEWFHHNKQKGVTQTIVNRYRIMPEYIISLDFNEAFVFNTCEDTIYEVKF